MPKPENDDITYRRAIVTDAASIVELVLTSQKKFTFHEFSEQGRAHMRELYTEQAMRSLIMRGDVHFVAEVEDELAGVFGMREERHVAHNFVAERYHRRGISSALWELARADCIKSGNPGVFTLRSSTYAVPLYERWGFVATDKVQTFNGIVFVPMQLDLQD